MASFEDVFKEDLRKIMNDYADTVSTGGATMLGNLDLGSQPINSDDGIDQVRRDVSAVGAALTVTDGEFTMSSSTPITTTATVSAENNIPLITKYHRVKYLIKAL